MQRLTDMYQGAKAVVVGGSIGGLTAALVLRDIGFDVEVYERTPVSLLGRGGGIVLQPDTARWFAERSEQDVAAVSTSTSAVQYVDREHGQLCREERTWLHTAWGTFYRALLADLGEERYHLNAQAVGFESDSEDAEALVRFADGRTATADLVVFADGVGSVARPIFDSAPLSRYSGYIGWRGTVPLEELSEQSRELLSDAMTYNMTDHAHIMLYPIPGEDGVGEADRLMNYVWYRNVDEGSALTDVLTGKNGRVGTLTVPPPPGQVQDKYVDEMRYAARTLLASGPSEVVLATKDPYVQVIHDLRSARMRHGRAVLIGDAACAARPHAAAGTAKAAADAWALRDALLATDGRIGDALSVWEPGQLALSKALLERAVSMGERSQIHNNWIPGDPDLKFGLYGSGITTQPSPPDYRSLLENA